MNLQKLTVHHYDEIIEDERRFTLSPANITVVAAAVEDVQIRGISVRPVTVLFIDGGSIEITINHSDLSQLEEAVGSYCFGD